MSLTGRPAQNIRGRLPGLAACALAALLPGQVAAQGDLVGLWQITVHDGTAQGDHGQIEIRQTAGGLVGEMVFNDVSDSITATQSCRVWNGNPTIQIFCTVLTVDPANYAPEYFPDNLIVRLVSPDLMEGQMVSATTGTATLTRGETPTS
jgi:hypothetical protein